MRLHDEAVARLVLLVCQLAEQGKAVWLTQETLVCHLAEQHWDRKTREECDE